MIFETDASPLGRVAGCACADPVLEPAQVHSRAPRFAVAVTLALLLQTAPAVVDDAAAQVGTVFDWEKIVADDYDGPPVEFGRSVAYLGPLIGAQIADIVVGSPGGPAPGGSLIFRDLAPTGIVLTEFEVTFDELLDAGDAFGRSVTNLGNIDGTVAPELAVGAPSADSGGAVWIVQDLFFTPQKIGQGAGGFGGTLDSSDQFGTSVAALADLDSDGVTDLAVGAPGDNDGCFDDCGAVWVLFLNADGTVKSEQKISQSAGGFGGALDNFHGFGTSVAALGDLDGDGVTELAVGTPGDNDGCVQDCGAVWVLFLNADGTVKSEQKISQSAGGFGGALDNLDLFGASVARVDDLDGDTVPELAVGATAVFAADAVWMLFLNADGTVKGEQEISETAGGFGGALDDSDRFGDAVASIGDFDGDGVPDLAVGASLDSDVSPNRGAVWLLNIEGRPLGLPVAVRSEQKISDLAGGFGGTLDDSDIFGVKIARLGDLDGDGVSDLAVGAPGDDDGGSNRGAVWVLFLNADGTVKSEQKISQTAGSFGGTLDNFDNFGGSIAALGDLDGDGVPDLAVGATGDSDGGTQRGAVWVLHLNADGTVKSEQKISQTAGGFGGALDDIDRFGRAVTALGDLDGDGVTDLAVGASNDDDGGPDRGAVWLLFLNADGTVKSEQKISQTAGAFGGVLNDDDVFGSSLTALGDLDGDSVTDLAVGAPQDDDGGGPSRGAVWVLFLNSDGTVKDEQKISQTAGGLRGALDDADFFGSDVTALGDLDGDGLTELAVGASGTDDGGPGRGAVWVLYLSPGGTVKQRQRISDLAGLFDGILADGDSFGFAVAPLGDLDGDGELDLVVGAFNDDDGGLQRGAAWVLFLDTTTTVELTVTYNDPTIVSGPLSFGLAALPAEVTATFRYVSPGLTPALGVPLSPTVLAASLSFGDARLATADLTSFSLTFDEPGVLGDLSYAFSPIDTATVHDGIQLNHDFALHVTGVDKASGQPFEYSYTRSSEVPAVAVAPSCPAAPEPACLSGVSKGLFSVDERTPGAEKLLMKWTGGPTLAGTDFGNPLDAGGTAYAACVYDGGDNLAATYVVDRAGYLCGTKGCWKAVGKPPGDPDHKGYKYKDADASADGVLQVKLRGGAAGDSKALVKGKNGPNASPRLPTGVAAALAGSAGVTVQLIGDDAPACLSVDLPDVVADEGNRFKAKR